MKTEKIHSKRKSLKRIETGLLLELGQKEAAVSVATSIVEENPDGNRERAFLADTFARCSSWDAAEEEFAVAHRICLTTGKLDKAFSLAAGPLFLLAEARGDFRRCLEIAPVDVLRNRALRLACGKPEISSVPTASPWREIAILEKVHLGGNPHVLPGLLADWTCGESEWRWRIIFEGAELAVNADMGAKPWRKYMKQTTAKVLDPRYFIERRDLKKLLSRGFGTR